MALSPVGDAGAVPVPAHDFHLCVTTWVLLPLTLISALSLSSEITELLMRDNLMTGQFKTQRSAWISGHKLPQLAAERLLAEQRRADPCSKPVSISVARHRPGRGRGCPYCIIAAVCPSCNEQEVAVPSASPRHCCSKTCPSSDLSRSARPGSPAPPGTDVAGQQQLVPRGWRLPEPIGGGWGDKAGSVLLPGACHALRRAVTGSWEPESVCEAREGTVRPGTAWGVRLAELALRTGSSLTWAAGV